MDGFEVDHDFPGLGHRIMVLNARKVIYETGPNTTILLAFTDITDRRVIEREKEELLATTKELLRQKQVLLEEIQHRVANSLQIIASILMLQARAVTTEETRHHLRDAHRRVLSIAQVQNHLHVTGAVDQVDMGSYLSNLCTSLAGSMIGGAHPIELKVVADGSQIGSDKAVSIGLIVTELVINAIKYAFPDPRPGAQIRVAYRSTKDSWQLTVSDNGVGKSADDKPRVGLGTAIVQALVKQLDARLEIISGSGMTVEIAHGAPMARLPKAA
jgi:chemotaxis protein methyltransferase CheR